MNLPRLLDKHRAVRRSYRAIFNTPDGEEVLKHICKMCFVFNTSMNTQGLTEFNEGRRSIALEIMAILHKDEDDMLNMIRETHQENEHE